MDTRTLTIQELETTSEKLSKCRRRTMRKHTEREQKRTEKKERMEAFATNGGIKKRLEEREKRRREKKERMKAFYVANPDIAAKNKESREKRREKMRKFRRQR